MHAVLASWLIVSVLDPQSRAAPSTAFLFQSGEAYLQTQSDRYGAPLPPGAIARIGKFGLNHVVLDSSALSPDGKLFAVSILAENKIRVWDVAKSKELWFHRHKGWQSTSLAFSPNGKYLAVTENRPQSVLLLDPSTGAEIDRFRPW